MNRWSPGLASPVGQDGDPVPGGAGGPAFKGMDMMSERDQLPPGMVPLSVNKRFRTGSAMKRMGTIEPEEFNNGFGNNPLYPIVGSGIFSDPNGAEVMLVAVKNASFNFGEGAVPFVWVLQTGQDPKRIPFATGTGDLVNVNKVRFCQAFDKVALFREPILTRPTLVWDGDPDGEFVNVDTLIVTGAGGEPTPATSAGETFQNRILLYSPFAVNTPRRDQIIMTDPGNISTYDPVFGDFRINSGQADFMVRAFQYFKGAVVGFKHRSIHMLENFSVDPTQGSQRQISGEIGLCGHDAVVRDGADVLFLSEPNGVYRLSEVIEDQIVSPAIPVSTPIDPAIRSINWAAARNAVAGTEEEYAFFAVPLGVRGYNNAVLVYNRSTRLWESGDLWGDWTFGISAMHTTNYNGRRTLFGLDYRNRRVYALYQSVPDEINGQTWHIHDIIETRGYNLGDSTRFKRYQRMAIAISTVDPEVSVTAISDGFNEQKVLTPTPITKRRFKFYTHGHADFDGTTDPDEPKREDYSISDFEFAATGFEGLLEGPIMFLPAAGSYVEAPAQQSLERIQVRTNGRWVSLRIENTSGRCDLLAVAVEGIAGNVETRTAA
jgi:hypothetical protein